MKSTTYTHTLFAFALLSLGLLLGSACGGVEEEEASDCNPEIDSDCACLNQNGWECDANDPDDPSCVCMNADMHVHNGKGCLLPDRDLLVIECGPPIDDNPAPSQEGDYRYILVEDLTDEPLGDAPGTDLDAISITLSNGVEHFATTVEDAEIGGASNDWTNTDEIKGAPDSGCAKGGFVALGGAGAGGYIIVGFSTNTEEVSFGSGSAVTVYELGPTTCPSQPEWDDDPYKVSVSVSSDLASFIELGTGGPGQNIIPIP